MGKCPGGKCPGGICPWGKCPGGTCPGGGGGYVLEPGGGDANSFRPVIFPCCSPPLPRVLPLINDRPLAIFDGLIS